MKAEDVQTTVDANAVIENLLQQVTQLSFDKALLETQVEQLQMKLKESNKEG